MQTFQNDINTVINIDVNIGHVPLNGSAMLWFIVV